MTATAIVFAKPQELALSTLAIASARDGDVVVETLVTGISTGTERLLWSGEMPAFPGMGYPLVPGYETVGRVVGHEGDVSHTIGTRVFVPGARCFADVRCLFGGSASRLVTPALRAIPVPDALADDEAVLLALAATAHHALVIADFDRDQELVVLGHGVLGRLVARIAVALGVSSVTVVEREPRRHSGAQGYAITSDIPRAAGSGPIAGHVCIIDVTGDPAAIDPAIALLARRGRLVLAGFYRDRLSFAFTPAFMKEAELRIAAEWQPEDMTAVTGLVAASRLSLDGLVTHRVPIARAGDAYRTAFSDPTCLKMTIDWRSPA